MPTTFTTRTFVEAVNAAAAQVARHPSGDLRRDLDTLAHSILSLIDGVTDSCPPLDLVPDGEDEAINGDVMLHDLLGEVWRSR
jgi:hypothetical protein